MATTRSNLGPDHLDVYRASYVIWTRDDFTAARELREDLFGGRTPEEAAAHAVRRGKETCRTFGSSQFDRVEIAAISRVFTMARCAECGQFRGPEKSAILCDCQGLRCERCGRQNIPPPISDYYDEERGGFWHVPHFASRRWCGRCNEARNEARERFSRQRPWGDDVVLVEPGSAIACAEELRQLCIEPLTEALLYLAVWAPSPHRDDPDVEDGTFVVLFFQPDEDCSAYVQFLSDALHRTVCWEVSSLDYQPGLADRLTLDQQTAPETRGFSKGERPSNYRREVRIDGDPSARQVARETLDILFDVLRYRGDETLVLRIEAERPAGADVAPQRFEPAQLAVLLRLDGYGVRVVAPDPAGEPRLEVRSGAEVAVTVAWDPNGRVFTVTTPTGRPARGEGPASRKCPGYPWGVLRDVDGVEVLARNVAIEPSVTEQNLLHAIRMLALQAMEFDWEKRDADGSVKDDGAPAVAGMWLRRR